MAFRARAHHLSAGWRMHAGTRTTRPAADTPNVRIFPMNHEESAAPSPELETLNVDDLDVEELEQRLELAVAESCDCTWNDCTNYCNQPK